MSSSADFTGRSQYTPLKQSNLKYLLDVHISVSMQIQAKNDWIDGEYFYADICAGDGGDEIEGSPVIFTDAQKRHGLRCKPYFIERSPIIMGSLRRRLENKDAVWICEDHCKALPEIAPQNNKVGLLYYDPNGDPFNNYPNLLSNFYKSSTTGRIDCLLYFSGTTIKRVLKAPGTNREWSISEDMERIGKKVWLIREPFGKSQWTFLLGVNWIQFPEFKKIDFHNIKSKKGQNILNKINYTAKELKEKNIKLYNQPQQMDMFSGFEGGPDARA